MSQKTAPPHGEVLFFYLVTKMRNMSKRYQLTIHFHIPFITFMPTKKIFFIFNYQTKLFDSIISVITNN